jgi:hypothetical protein
LVKTKTLRVNATETKQGKKPLLAQTEQFLMMDYTRLIPILTQAIKEQQELINILELRISALESVIE